MQDIDGLNLIITEAAVEHINSRHPSGLLSAAPKISKPSQKVESMTLAAVATGLNP